MILFPRNKLKSMKTTTSPNSCATRWVQVRSNRLILICTWHIPSFQLYEFSYRTKTVSMVLSVIHHNDENKNNVMSELSHNNLELSTPFHDRGRTFVNINLGCCWCCWNKLCSSGNHMKVSGSFLSLTNWNYWWPSNSIIEERKTPRHSCGSLIHPQCRSSYTHQIIYSMRNDLHLRYTCQVVAACCNLWHSCCCEGLFWEWFTKLPPAWSEAWTKLPHFVC